MKKTTKKRTKKKATKRKLRQLQLVTPAWIVTTLGVHQSSIEPAWRRGELEVFHQVLAGKDKSGKARTRPVFEKVEAERWAAERAARLDAERRSR